MRVGVAALDAHVARKAADAGLDLTFSAHDPWRNWRRCADERGVLR